MKLDAAYLETESPVDGFAERGFEHARAFQNRTAEWAHDPDGEPVAVLRAPTGAGKTATFHELIEEKSLALVVYPTNALLHQQVERFDDEGVSAAPLNSDTLSGHGDTRVENILQFADRYAGHDIVVTNPDILQALIQDLYQGSSKPMRFFNQFDGVIYDEFHFYDNLAASGLLLQIHIFLDRTPQTQVLLASATPNESFVDFVREELNLPVRDIGVTYVADGDQFRYPVEVERHEATTMRDDREAIAEQLRAQIEAADDLTQPRVALVFNSVAASNDFHTFLSESYPSVFEHTAKDNGFDTNDPEAALDDETFYILNTTSKGEVGLNYDLRALFMETPQDPAGFLQRFGRAGRQQPATVHLYGLGDMGWPEKISYPDFVDSVYEGLGSEHSHDTDISALRDLVGMRAAHALHSRSKSDEWFNEELREDFTSVTEYGRWRGFLADVEDTLSSAGGLSSPIRTGGPETKILRFTQSCFGAFRGLRGRSLPVDVRYPRGDRMALTTYDLLTTLRYYDVTEIATDGSVVVERRSEGRAAITARFPGYENRPRNYTGSNTEVREMFTRWLYPAIEDADISSTAVDEGLLRRFFDVVPIEEAALPIEVRYDRYVIYVDTGGIPTINIEQRQI